MENKQDDKVQAQDFHHEKCFRKLDGATKFRMTNYGKEQFTNWFHESGAEYSGASISKKIDALWNRARD